MKVADWEILIVYAPGMNTSKWAQKRNIIVIWIDWKKPQDSHLLKPSNRTQTKISYISYSNSSGILNSAHSFKIKIPKDEFLSLISLAWVKSNQTQLNYYSTLRMEFTVNRTILHFTQFLHFNPIEKVYVWLFFAHYYLI